MSMYNLIEYSDNYSKTPACLSEYYRDDTNDDITPSESFKYRIKVTGRIPAASNTKDAEIAMPLRYLSNFQGTLKLILF